MTNSLVGKEHISNDSHVYKKREREREGGPKIHRTHMSAESIIRLHNRSMSDRRRTSQRLQKSYGAFVWYLDELIQGAVIFPVCRRQFYEWISEVRGWVRGLQVCVGLCVDRKHVCWYWLECSKSMTHSKTCACK